jgi:hypothetical protein
MKSLKIHTLSKGWHDKDNVLLHAAFQLLVDFIEQEKPDHIVDWNADPDHAAAWKEFRSLYRWWTRTRPARRSPLDDKDLKRPPFETRPVPGSEYFERVPYDRREYAAYDAALRKDLRLEQKWFEEDQRNLHRLVDLRPYLWC